MSIEIVTTMAYNPDSNDGDYLIGITMAMAFTSILFCLPICRSGAAGSKKTLKKEIADPQALVTMEEFHKRSFFYSYMLNFSSSLQQACDLSQVLCSGMI